MRFSRSGSPDVIDLAKVQTAAERIAGRVVRTPTIPADAISRLTGADVSLKLDNLQVTGAFKERGAAASMVAQNLSADAFGDKLAKEWSSWGKVIQDRKLTIQ